MKIFRITVTTESTPDEQPFQHARYHATLGDVKRAVRQTVPKNFWGDTVVEELEMLTDKASIIFALNHTPVIIVSTTFNVTSRGALKEEL